LQLPFADNPKGMPFIELQSVDSTNKYAMNLVYAGMAQHGMSVFAHDQTFGKGQRGKEWASEKGANIALSVIINPFPLQLFEQFKLSVCTAV
jgi:BirA family biotin operon repressor/biotin-[acetyl-CoA-carboxylase] ligase